MSITLVFCLPRTIYEAPLMTKACSTNYILLYIYTPVYTPKSIQANTQNSEVHSSVSLISQQVFFKNTITRNSCQLCFYSCTPQYLLVWDPRNIRHSLLPAWKDQICYNEIQKILNTEPITKCVIMSKGKSWKVLTIVN